MSYDDLDRDLGIVLGGAAGMFVASVIMWIALILQWR